MSARKRTGHNRTVRTSYIFLCGPTDCPNDLDFEHDNYYGCIPKDFRQLTGRSKKYRQQRVESDEFELGYRYLWNGGCDLKRLASLSYEGTQE